MFSTFHCLLTPKATQTDEPNMSVSEGEVPMDSQRDRECDMRDSDMAVCEMERDLAEMEDPRQELERFVIWI